MRLFTHFLFQSHASHVRTLTGMSRRCVLRCSSVTADSHPDIVLPDGEEIIVGRSKYTKIQDTSCSRQQISLKANYADYTVVLKQLGVNPSGLDGFSLERNSIYTIGHRSNVEILLNKYPHVIEFDPAPENEHTKRKLEENDSRLSKVPKVEIESNLINDLQSSSQATTVNKWDCIDNGELYVFTSKGVKSASKIASFDMDGTIIKTKSGKVHPVDTRDWQISMSEVYSKLKLLNSKGYKIVFLTNQAAIGNGRVNIEHFKKKLQAIVDKLAVPIQAFVATGKGMYRKPLTGMWDVLVEENNEGVAINKEESFYCGDAAGRPANWAPGKKADHSHADRLLAENIGLKFYTPEEYFMGHPYGKVKPKKPEFDPKGMKTEQFKDELISSEQEIVVLVGYPGSGKSTLCSLIARKSSGRYVPVCRDDMGSWQRCAATAEKLLKEGKSVIVDSTNPDEESRSRWVSLARGMKVPIRCAVMQVDMAHAMHNNKYRALLKSGHVNVGNVVFHSYKKKYKQPSLSEGFKEVLQVPFCPSFESEEAKKLYHMHLLEN